MRVQLVQKINAKWMREFLTYDPAKDLAHISVPVLAIAGSKDIQVDPGDLQRMKELVMAQYEAHELPDVMHLLRRDPGEPTLANYKKQILEPVEPELLNAVLEWLDRRIAG